MRKLNKILVLLTLKERKQAAALVGMILIMAIFDVLGVASIMPFMAVLANSEIIDEHRFLSSLYIFMGFKDSNEFLIALGGLVFVMLLFSLMVKAATTFMQVRFALMCEHSIGRRLIGLYLNQPYSWFLNRHSADLGKNILTEVGAVINYGIMPLMNLLAQGTVSLALLTFLLIVNPTVALSVVIILGFAYVMIYITMSRILKKLGESRIKANNERYKSVIDAFNATKDIKLGGLEDIYVNKFSLSAEVYARGQAVTELISHLPRYFIEAIAFGGMILVILYLMISNGSFETALPTIALYVFTGYRIIPALQQIYRANTQLKFSGPAIDALYNDFTSLVKPITLIDETSIKFCEKIALENISYCYPQTDNIVIKNISLAIPYCKSIAFVGTTGSGKSTLVDLILGLLEPNSGKLTIDGKILNSQNVKKWQEKIGYVPQQIFLSDETIAKNIAFGINVDKINMQLVEEVTTAVGLHDFIKELPDGYKTSLGERGVRLSGGQRQRIAIARALYKKPDLLILDEATSALDGKTEKLVMEAVRKLSHKITIIMIAHRLSTVKHCDQIYIIEDGQLSANGTYSELVNHNESFRGMNACL